MDKNLLLSKAIALAGRAHAGQVDKNGEAYILHPLRVMQRVLETGDIGAAIVAVLHDVPEDCQPKFVEQAFELAVEAGTQYGAALVLLTHIPGQSYQEYLGPIKRSSIAVTVKRADLADNLGRLDKITDEKTKARLFFKYTNAFNTLNSEE